MRQNKAYNAMGEPVLSDFGLAKLLNAASLTASGTFFETPLYISPEQVRNLPVSDQTDIYALGVILYEIFTGAPPFQGDSLTGIMMQHLLDAPPSPHFLDPQLPPGLVQVVLKCLAKKPQDRFPSAASLIAAMTEALNGRSDPVTGQQQIGVSQIYRDVQLLTSFDVKPYK